jgi:eukaryotic-like serine/threonine-protein kinase
MITCIDENGVLDFIARKLPSVRLGEVESHLDSCDSCRELLAHAARAAMSGEEVPEDDPIPRSGVVPGRAVGRYHVLYRVGGGGMGVVFAARDLELRRTVALKVLRPGDGAPSKKMRARLLREARAAAAVRHGNVVAVHEVFEHEGLPVLVMDLLEGESLRARLSRVRALSVEATLAVIAPVLSALETAHGLGVVHRDLKPDNIFLVAAGGRELVKILDFGVAKLTAAPDAPVSGSLTESGALVGTPHYMAPEQAFGERDVDSRADLWSVGVVLYECLAGVRPIAGSNLGQVLKALTERAIRPIEEVVPGLPPQLVGLLGRLLSDREERPTAAEARQEVEQIRGDVASGVVAGPARRRRRGWLVGAGAAAAVAAIAIVGAQRVRRAPAAPVAETAATAARAPSVEAARADAAVAAPPAVRAPAPTVPAPPTAEAHPRPAAPKTRPRANPAEPAASSPSPPEPSGPAKLITQPPF